MLSLVEICPVGLENMVKISKFFTMTDFESVDLLKKVTCLHACGPNAIDRLILHSCNLAVL